VAAEGRGVDLVNDLEHAFAEGWAGFEEVAASHASIIAVEVHWTSELCGLIWSRLQASC